MIGFSLVYIVAIIFVVLIIGLIINAKKRNILIAIPATVIGIPVILAGLLFAFKSPIQQGKILQNTTLGPLLNFISPPSDLYLSLDSTNLEPKNTEYTLYFSHKYLGNHALMVSSPKPAKEERPSYADISVTLSVSDGEKELFKMGPERAGQFFGRNDYGAFLASYKVPRDLPVSKQLTANVKITGNLIGFLERRGSTVLKIQKFSDE
jgi:hypothetical protein